MRNLPSLLLEMSSNEVVIIFDDISSPTRAAEVAPKILRELKEGRNRGKNIRFIASLGGHGAMRLTDFMKKLGPAVV